MTVGHCRSNSKEPPNAKIRQKKSVEICNGPSPTRIRWFGYLGETARRLYYGAAPLLDPFLVRFGLRRDWRPLDIRPDVRKLVVSWSGQSRHSTSDRPSLWTLG